MHLVGCTIAIYHDAGPYKRQIRKKVIENKICIAIFLYNFFVCNVSRSQENWARYGQQIHIGFHVKYPVFLLELFKTLQFFEKYSNAKCY